jgi:hypothetical protein
MDRFAEPRKIANLLAALDCPWWVCGGWAIDLFLDQATRPHKDVDIAVQRHDQRAIQAYLTSRGWRLEKAAGGALIPWATDEHISLPIHVIWCKHATFDPNFFELLFNEVDAAVFRFRRDLSITCSVTQMSQQTASGIPILAPEIVLLYKAGNPSQEGYTADFVHVFPRLSLDQRNWLYTNLVKRHPGHAWLVYFG